MDFLFWFLVCTTYEIENFMTGKRRKKHVGCLKEGKKEKEERENETENVKRDITAPCGSCAVRLLKFLDALNSRKCR